MSEETKIIKLREQSAGHCNEATTDDDNGQGIKIGTEKDAVDMHRLGKEQQFKRNFRSFSVLGLSSVVMATWVAIFGSATFSLINGGLAGTVWTYLGIWVFTLPVTLSLAEMASMRVKHGPNLASRANFDSAPTTGGQYHWTSEFSPPSCQKFLSYIVRWDLLQSNCQTLMNDRSDGSRRLAGKRPLQLQHTDPQTSFSRWHL